MHEPVDIAARYSAVNGGPLQVVRNLMVLGLLWQRREDVMLYTLAVILLIAWLLGIVGTYTIGAFVHLLLVVAIVLFIVALLS